jgi:hypothetical protein
MIDAIYLKAHCKDSSLRVKKIREPGLALIKASGPAGFVVK